MTKLDEIPGWDPDSFESRLRLSVAGNILDFAIYADLDMADAMETIREAFTKPLDTATVAKLKEKMDAAENIFWIFDNCGEAVFDRLLIEPYRKKMTLAVRGKPAFNDITAAELEESGYGPDFARAVVSNDDGVPGVVPKTGEFRDVERPQGSSDRLPLPREMPLRRPGGQRHAALDSGDPAEYVLTLVSLL